jgi:hypothetical protein
MENQKRSDDSLASLTNSVAALIKQTKEDPPKDIPSKENPAKESQEETADSDQDVLDIHPSKSDMESLDDSPASSPARPKRPRFASPVRSNPTPNRGDSDKEQDDSQAKKSFAQKKKILAGIVKLEGKEVLYKKPSSIIEQQMMECSEDTLMEYSLPLSTVVKESLSKANSVIRHAPPKSFPDGPEWSVDDLPPPGPKAKPGSILQRSDLGMTTMRRNHYATIELPYSADPTVGQGANLSKLALYASRRDALDTLQAQSYTEQAIGAAVTILKDKSTVEQRETAADFLLSSVLSLKTQVSLVTRILANTTMAARNLEPQGALRQEFHSNLLTMPIETQEVLPHRKDMERFQDKNTSQAKVLSDTLKNFSAENNRLNFARGRGKSAGPRNRGNRKPSTPMDDGYVIPKIPQKSRGGKQSFNKSHKGGKHGKKTHKKQVSNAKASFTKH